ncbi:MAG: hypothetical protein KKB90_01160, partial [Actinobacteria bacterium]|nr:hypothetical protein [Actinomycetota bacterium]MBU4217557.1 hypothetical protein [Actinomycetota bacterium]MBU4360126.1 hypothetical protein [Actinomycetota bacterium]MBU4402518.1 hypothetical protein [Actinomycetota bacterium]MBU4440986.1 hypothetical protein [Actinomycetota bacterium]
MFLGHVNSRGQSLHQRIPFPLDVIGAKLEYRVMAALGRITDADYLYRFGFSRSFFNWLANRLVVPLVHGEVLTSLVPRSINTVSYRERRGAAHARRATELYSVSTARERNAAGADASTFE